MRKIKEKSLLSLLGLVLVIAACNSNSKESASEKKDSIVKNSIAKDSIVKDSIKKTEPEYNPASPPLQNGQF